MLSNSDENAGEKFGENLGKNLAKNLIPSRPPADVPDGSYFVSGISPAMRSIERVILEIAPSEIPILLMGESGTGKEIIALEIRRRSRRAHEAFVKITCAGLEPESLSSQLASGRMSGTTDSYSGGGTVFLNEVSHLDLTTQSRLLQLLPEGNTTAPSARLIAATAQNLEEQMRAGRFREELYYRLNGVCLRLPPLRYHTADIPVLLDFFLKKYADIFGRPVPHLGTSTMDLLLRHPWPGNIRELENFARKMVVLGDEHLALDDLSATATSGVTAAAAATKSIGAANGRSLKDAAREAARRTEQEMIMKVLQRTHWNRKRSARELQISYKALLYKLKQLGLSGDSEEPGQ